MASELYFSNDRFLTLAAMSEMLFEELFPDVVEDQLECKRSYIPIEEFPVGNQYNPEEIFLTREEIKEMKKMKMPDVDDFDDSNHEELSNYHWYNPKPKDLSPFFSLSDESRDKDETSAIGIARETAIGICKKREYFFNINSHGKRGREPRWKKKKKFSARYGVMP